MPCVPGQGPRYHTQGSFTGRIVVFKGFTVMIKSRIFALKGRTVMHKGLS